MSAPPLSATVVAASASGASRKVIVGRPIRHALLLGLDGAGKTALAKALADPAEPCFPVLPTDLEIADRVARARDAPTAEERGAMSRPFVLWRVDDRLLTRNKATLSAPLTGIGRLPPPVQVTLMDPSGVPPHRLLWLELLMCGRRKAAAGTLVVDDDDPDAFPVVNALVFVISAHDTLRLHLAWSELLRLLASTPDDMPVLIVVVQVEQSTECVPRMLVADVLKVVEDFAPLPTNRKGGVSIVGADLRAADPTLTGGAAFALSDLRQIGEWLLNATTTPDVQYQ